MKDQEDHTARRQLALARQGSKERYCALFDQAADAIVVFDPETLALVDFNDEACRRLGFTRQEFAALRISDFEVIESAEETRRHAQNVTTDSVEVFETRHRTKRGDVLDIEVRVKAIRLGGKKLLQCVWRDITARKQADEEMQHRLALEQVLAAASSRLVNAPAADLDVAVHEVLADVGRLMGADRCYLFRVSDDLSRVDNTHEWCAPGIHAQIADLHNIPSAEFPWMLAQLRDGAPLCVRRLEDIPPEARAERQLMQQGQVQSFILVPIRHGGVLTGFIGCDAVQRERRWPEADIRLLRLVGEILADAQGRCRANAALAQAATEWQTTFDSVADAVCVLDCDQRILRSNKAAEVLFAKSSAEMLGRRCCEIVHGVPQPLPGCPIGRMKHSLKRESTELARDGRWYQVVVDPLLDPGGGLCGAVHAVRDITQQKQAEESLRESEERFRVAAKSAAFVPAQCDRDLRYLWIYNLHPDFDPSKVLGKRDDELDDSEGARQLVAMKQRVMDSGTGAREQIDFQRSNGCQTYDITAEPVRDAAGTVVGVRTASFNVTERKRAQESLRTLAAELERRVEERTAALRASEARYRTLVEQLPAVTYTAALDQPTTTFYISPQIEGMLGFTPEECMANSELWRQQLHPEDRDRVLREVRQHKGARQAWVSEYRMLRRDGTVIWVEDFAAVVANEAGKPAHLHGVMFDVTARKQSEQALKESLTRLETLQAIVSRGPVVLFLWRCAPGEWPVEMVSDNVTAVLGYKDEDFMSGRVSWPGITHPDDVPRLEAEVAGYLERGVAEWSQEYRVTNKAGKIRWIQDWNRTVKDASGTITHIQGMVVDVTVRRQSEARFRAVFENAPVGISLVDTKLKLNDANPALEKIVRLTRKQLLAGTYRKRKYLRPDGTEMPQAEFASRRALREKQTVRDVETGIRTENGQIVWTLVSATPLGTPPDSAVVITRDITARKESALALERTHRALRVLTEGNRLLLRATREHDLLKEACRIVVEVGGYRIAWVGYAEHDARKSIRPMALVGCAKDCLARVPLTWAATKSRRCPGGEAIRTRKPCVCRDISRGPMSTPCRRQALKLGCTSALALPLLMEQHCLGVLTIYAAQPEAFDEPEVQLLEQLASDLSFGIAALRDREHRRQLEKQVLDISEREQRRIGQDLHDGLSQSLTGIHYLLSSVQQTLAARAAPEAAELERITRMMGKTARQSHDMARGLFVGELTRGQITDALLQLAIHTEDLFGIPCRYSGPPTVRLANANLASQMFRIAQEAVNNAAKHSKAGRIDIRLSQKLGRVALIVRDTGIGMARSPGNAAGMGHRIMKYRAEMIGATLTVESVRGKGTTVTCVLPLEPKQELKS